MIIVSIIVATGSGHLDYPGHLGHFLSGSKWISPRHAYMPDPDQDIKNCNEYINTLIEHSLIFQGCDLESS